jgi:hypothetical protein
LNVVARDEQRTVFVERSSTIECYHKPPPNLEMIASKQASLFYKTNKYFQIMKNDTGYP